MMDNQYPEKVFNKKDEEISSLRQTLSVLYETYDCMRNYEKDFLFYRYGRLIGAKRYALLEIEIQARKKKLIFEMAMASINRNEKPDFEAIEEQVRVMLTEFYTKLHEMDDLFNQDLTSISHDELEELKKLYRLLVKRLHPDLNPGQSDKEKDLFIQVQTAYKSFDLDFLRSVALKIDLEDPKFPLDENIINKLNKAISKLREQIDLLEKLFPFTYRSKLDDAEWVKNENERMDASIEEFKKQSEFYDRRIDIIR